MTNLHGNATMPPKNTLGVFAMKGIIRQRGKCFQVRYWDKETKTEINGSFASHGDAEMFLAHLNVSRHEGKLDARDYRKDNPLGFRTQAEHWLSIRQDQLKDYRHVHSHIRRAIAVFGDRNVKEIGYGGLEDFFHALPQGLSGKTRHNIRTSLHSLWSWIAKR